MIDLGKQLLERDYTKDIRKQERWAKKEASASGMGGKVGGLLGGLLPMLLLSATLGPAGMALAAAAGAGLGTFAGSKIGGSFVPDVKSRFGVSNLEDLKKQMKEKETADAIVAGVQGGTMSYMGGLGAGGVAPVDPLIAEEAATAAQTAAQTQISSLAGVGPHGQPIGPLSSLPNIGALQAKQANLAQLVPGSQEYKTLASEIAGLQKQLPGGALTGNQMTLGGNEYDLSFVKDYQAAVEAGTGDAFLKQYGQQYGQTAYTEAAQASMAAQKAGSMLPGRGYMSPGKRIGLYGKGGETLFAPDMSAAGGWMKEHPWLSTMGGGGLLAALLMMMKNRD